ncbi:MAG: M1 family metallopeptidase [Candidatus Doudnabacteria bacterium]|nr:M1 family metallopeptidase [Candidatus Doudnabacteria bacterium]
MKNVRLSKQIKPERYELFIKPDLKTFAFDGEETISLTLGKPVSEITIHAKELDVYSAHFGIGNQKVEIKSESISYDVKNETVTFSFGKTLPRGRGVLNLKFKGVLNEKMRGFYRSSYTHQGKQKHMATTQFEATDARMAFPCFDEPAHKAIFDVTLMVPSNLTAISNTIESEILEHESGYKTVKFAPTPRMSTYLLAFIVGDFEFIERKTKDGVLVRVFVTPGKKHQAKFALDTAIRCLEFYNQYFDIPYPLPVLDLIAIPDFSHGAMENWGAVTYRESALLVDPEHSSAANKQWVALVIAHELAHQWFGNLVTMEWWTHLWLNEGFASYIEYLATDHLFPKWDMWTQFAYNDLNPAMELDGLKNTHPIEVEVGHPDEIGEIFDEISYSKGSSVIRMLAGYLGEKNFRDGLRYYLKKHAYQNASTTDLWQAFEKVSKKPVRKIMENWTGKGGYPLLKLALAKTSQKSLTINISQARFFSSPLSKSADKTLWQIPVSAKSVGGDKINQYLLSTRHKAFNILPTDRLKINFGETGFFRTQYHPELLMRLAQPVRHKSLPPIDRLGIMRDLSALSEAGNISSVTALEFIGNYKNETDYTVWVELSSAMADLKNLLYSENCYPQFEKFSRDVFTGIGAKLGWKAASGESHTRGLLRSLVLNQLIGYNHQPTIDYGVKMYKSGVNLPADIRAAAYHARAAAGSATDHRRFVSRYQKEALSEEKNRLGRALGQFGDERLLSKTLEFAMSNKVRIQDTAAIFAAVWANPKGQKIAWDFTKRHWDILVRRYPPSGHILNRFVKMAAGFTKPQRASEVSEFFKKHKAPGAERSVAQVLEKINSNAAWLSRDGGKIAFWLLNAPAKPE